MKMCEYCEIKIINPNIEKFFQLGRQWRESDKAMLIQKQNYYKSKQNELKETAEVQKEATHLDKVVRDKEL